MRSPSSSSRVSRTSRLSISCSASICALSSSKLNSPVSMASPGPSIGSAPSSTGGISNSDFSSSPGSLGVSGSSPGYRGDSARRVSGPPGGPFIAASLCLIRSDRLATDPLLPGRPLPGRPLLLLLGLDPPSMRANLAFSLSVLDTDSLGFPPPDSDPLSIFASRFISMSVPDAPSSAPGGASPPSTSGFGAREDRGDRARILASLPFEDPTDFRSRELTEDALGARMEDALGALGGTEDSSMPPIAASLRIRISVPVRPFSSGTWPSSAGGCSTGSGIDCAGDPGGAMLFALGDARKLLGLLGAMPPLLGGGADPSSNAPIFSSRFINSSVLDGPALMGSSSGASAAGWRWGFGERRSESPFPCSCCCLSSAALRRSSARFFILASKRAFFSARSWALLLPPLGELVFFSVIC
mmetsp:Transcript_7678/g.11912  ORF Transcript_7678/g.11912 Transcript_7678/m.11912 type:complete len:414 (+) Transcript_7678:1181-2422(+)